MKTIKELENVDEIFDLITIWTDKSKFSETKDFYLKMFNFEIIQEQEGYIELDGKNIRISVVDLSVMLMFSDEFKKLGNGQKFEIAYKVKNESKLEEFYQKVKQENFEIVTEIETAPWGQKLFLLKDPVGNVLEIYTNLN